MNKIALTVAALGLVGISTAQVANKSADFTLSSYTLKAGGIFPVDDDLSNLGDNLLAIGIEYRLPDTLLKGGETFISAEYWSRGLRFGKGSVIPITINQRFYGQRFANNGQTYAFLGIGVGIIDVNTSDNVFLGRAGLGINLNENIFAEVAGYISDRSNAGRANAIGFFFGYRF